MKVYHILFTLPLKMVEIQISNDVIQILFVCFITSTLDDSLYTLCHLDDFKFLADMIEHIRLPLKVGFWTLELCIYCIKMEKKRCNKIYVFH